jgi:ketosteroid isomerase-like protein
MSTTRRSLAKAAAGAVAATAILQTLPAGAQSGDEAAIKANIETFRAAMLAKDTAKLGELVADGLNYGHSAGVVENKEEFLKAVAARKAVMKALKYSDIKVQVNGGVAVARHIWESESELDGKQSQTRIGVFQVWQKQADGKWKIYGRQAHIFPPKA